MSLTGTQRQFTMSAPTSAHGGKAEMLRTAPIRRSWPWTDIRSVFWCVARSDALEDIPLTKPTTGMAGCCARAGSGHAAVAPPSRVMNSRRCH